MEIRSSPGAGTAVKTIPSGRPGEEGRDVKRILIADDDESIRWVLRKTVTGMGFAADLAEDGEQALALLGKNSYAAAFVDIRMPGVEGIEVLERVEARKSPTRFFIMTAVRRPDVAARSTRAGAAEFITKPFELSRIEELLRDLASEAASAERPYQPGGAGRLGIRPDRGKEPRPPRTVPEHREGGGLGRPDPAARAARRGEGADRPVHPRTGGPHGSLRGGEHPRRSPATSRRRSCSGTRRARSPGRRARREGKLGAAATDGTLFLDEIGDTPLDLQAKLLRVLQEREYTPVGSNQARKFRGGIIAATNRDLRENGGGREVPGGPLRPAERLPAARALPCRAEGGHPAAGGPLPAEILRRPLPPAALLLEGGGRGALRRARGRGTCGNWRTSSSAWRSSPRENCCGATTWCASWPGRNGAPETSSAPMEQLVEERIREFLRRLGPALDSETRLHELFVRQVERPLVKVVLEATGGEPDPRGGDPGDQPEHAAEEDHRALAGAENPEEEGSVTPWENEAGRR